MRLWGHGLWLERESRFEQTVADGEHSLSPHSERAIRGHITRTLKEELQRDLER